MLHRYVLSELDIYEAVELFLSNKGIKVGRLEGLDLSESDWTLSVEWDESTDNTDDIRSEQK